MDDLIPLAERIAERLKARGETIALAESSAGGLISAALLAVPGASAYFLGSAVIYTRRALRNLLDIPAGELKGIRSASEPYALLLARTMRSRFDASWAIAETGASGPTGNGYGDAPGHACLALAGAAGARAITIETGSTDRVANMRRFAASALGLLDEALG
jgi:PncC family amidohydrolase